MCLSPEYHLPRQSVGTTFSHFGSIPRCLRACSSRTLILTCPGNLKVLCRVICLCSPLCPLSMSCSLSSSSLTLQVQKRVWDLHSRCLHLFFTIQNIRKKQPVSMFAAVPPLRFSIKTVVSPSILNLLRKQNACVPEPIFHISFYCFDFAVLEVTSIEHKVDLLE